MKTLLVTPIPPSPPITGARQRTDLIFQALSDIATVDLVLVGRAKAPINGSESTSPQVVIPSPKQHHEKLPWRLLVPFSTPMARRLAHNLGRHRVMYVPDTEASTALRTHVDVASYDVVVGRYLAPSVRTGLLERNRVIVDVDDLESGIYQSISNAPYTSALKRRYTAVRHVRPVARVTRQLIASLDAAWVSNPDDATTLGLPNVGVLQNIPYFPEDRWPPFEAAASDSRVIVTVASMGYSPNVKGVDWFLERCWPKIRNVERGTSFRIVGGGISDAMRDRWSAAEGVEVVGFAENLADIYRRASFAIAPIHQGGGTKIKVLESLAYGRVCVVTPHSIQGLDAELIQTGAVNLARSDSEFVTCCLELLRNPVSTSETALVGRRIARNRYGVHQFKSVVHATVQSVLSARRSR